MTKFGYRIIGTAILAFGLSLSLAAYSGQGGQAAPAAAAPAAALAAPAGGAMPVAQQNALVQQYCVGCHDDLQMTGGLSLEHFDAAHPNPTVVAMMVGKLKGGAMPPKNMPRPNAGTLYMLIGA
ncbi:MAG TPA: hypothetical protein VNE16_07920, partial [Vicinamibacterales bacterium]|nr:hypothetical protein [Vicinamibacterales bacterium]